MCVRCNFAQLYYEIHRTDLNTPISTCYKEDTSDDIPEGYGKDLVSEPDKIIKECLVPGCVSCKNNYQ